MPQGVIRRVVSDRGFGFISGPDGDVFFHHTMVEGTSFDELQEGQAVEYEIDESAGSADRRGKGPRASVVRAV